MKTDLTLDQDLLFDLPTLEVFRNKNIHYYVTDDITQGQIVVSEMSKKDSEEILYIKNLSEDTDFGRIINFKDYLNSLKECAINQDLMDYRTIEKNIY